MLGWFPEIYPDELLASACARYADRLGYPNRSTAVRELFGDRCTRVAYDVPGHLNHFVGHLPSRESYSLQELLYRHTLFPFYVSLHSAERVELLERQIGDAPATVVYKSVGMIRYRERCLEFLRFCHDCASEDRMLYGEPYWHRNHQLPGVLVCTSHGKFLQSTRVPMHGACLIRAKHGIPRSPISADNGSTPDTILVELSNDAQRLLEDKIHLSLWVLRQRYRTQLEAMRLLRNDRILTKEAADVFVKSFSSVVLKLLSFNSHSQSVGSWIKQLAAGHIYHPLDHLVMMRFLKVPVL